MNEYRDLYQEFVEEFSRNIHRKHDEGIHDFLSYKSHEHIEDYEC